ncbi:MAG: glycosyltransferase family 4 protein [Candidatus Thorarchaeota archaeon]
MSEDTEKGRSLRVLHLVPVLPASDFVRKDMEYFGRLCHIEPSIARTGWSGRRNIFQKALSIARMSVSALKLRRRRVDVVHAHFLVSALTAALCGHPAILVMHDSHALSSPVLRTLMVLCARQCSIVYVSEYNKKYWFPMLKQEGTVIYHAIDRNVWKPEAASKELHDRIAEELDVDHLVFGMGALEPRRGLHLIVQAVKHVRDRGSDVGVVIKGYGGSDDYARSLLDMAREASVPLKLIREFLAAEVLVRLVASMDVFVRPTYDESFGIAVLEAQSCGVPAVVSDCCSLSEVFGD